MYIAPEYRKKSFTCVRCNVNAQQNWDYNYICGENDKKLIHQTECESSADIWYDALDISTCHVCGGYIIWNNKKIIHPLVSNVPLPNEDMSEDVKKLYLEARDVFPVSKKACAALMRLALQLLCKELGEEGKNINHDIAELVRKGANPNIQRALDTIRITGNQSVHPGVLDIEQDDEYVNRLFFLMNFIIEKMYTEPKKTEEFFSKMPVNLQVAIQERDKKIMVRV